MTRNKEDKIKKSRSNLSSKLEESHCSDTANCSEEIKEPLNSLYSLNNMSSNLDDYYSSDCSDPFDWMEKQARLAQEKHNQINSTEQSQHSSETHIKAINDLFVPKKAKEHKTVYVRMDKMMYERISHIAITNNISRSCVIFRLLEFSLQTLDKEHNNK